MPETNWARAWQNQQNDMCSQQRLWSTSGTFTQSDQSFRCPPEDGLGTELPIKCMAKILIIGLDKMLR